MPAGQNNFSLVEGTFIPGLQEFSQTIFQRKQWLTGEKNKTKQHDQGHMEIRYHEQEQAQITEETDLQTLPILNLVDIGNKNNTMFKTIRQIFSFSHSKPLVVLCCKNLKFSAF